MPGPACAVWPLVDPIAPQFSPVCCPELSNPASADKVALPPIRRCRPSDFAAMCRLPLFAGIDSGDLAGLRPQLSVLCCAAGTELWARNAPVDSFVILLKGQVHLLGPADSVVDVITAPAAIGEAAVFDSAGYPWRAYAIGGSRLIRVPAPAWHDALRQSPTLRRNLLAALSARQTELRREVWDLRHLPPGLRLAGLLLELRQAELAHGTDADSAPPPLWSTASRRVVASRLGMRAESLSRALARLAPFGVTRQGDEIAVTDPVALQAYFSQSRGQSPGLKPESRRVA